ncbi:MAG TPA: c-type cytochrome [Pirellulales bacterium]|nr:c-type cytochrome [Pirellulales bacterium]
MATRIALLLLFAFSICASLLADDHQIFTEKPQVAPTAENPTTPTPSAPDAGPKPSWIWGGSNDRNYVLMTTFMGGSKVARLKASADNKMTLYLNGHRVASSDNWQTPVEVDVQKHLQPGENTLLAEVQNEGGPAGFVLKLSLAMPDGSQRYIVSDEQWQAAEKRDSDTWVAARKLHVLGEEPWGDVFSGRASAGSQLFTVLPGFQVEHLFSVPKEELGSWVSITFDGKGRLIASDQGDKGLCRITPPAIGSDGPTKVERLDVKISSAQGMVYAFDSLYVSTNGFSGGNGLYRVKDTDGDDQFDLVEKLKDIRGGGEHGPHAVLLGPDGKSLFYLAGNFTKPPLDPAGPPDPNHRSRAPTNWGEDLLLPRQWDAGGFAIGVLAPGGWAAQTDPEGKMWDIVSNGYRNPYDMAFNADGELFVYDADMEWDMGTPWYRPTRVLHATSGSEFGWRSGTGKWPAYYVDSLPEVVDVGPGSPVGVAFGYGTKFPAKYQRALFICDWTFGTMYAVHLQPEGASYQAVKEEFVARSPLPLTDVAAGPDGALYFSTGGRGTQSELFRVTYVGAEPTSPVDPHDSRFGELRALRRHIEAYHQKADDPSKAIEFVYPYLGHADRHIRYAARVALEDQDVKLWQDRVLSESDPETLITGAVALARQGDKSLLPKLLAALERLELAKLAETQQLELVRAYQLAFIRMGEPDDGARLRLLTRLDALFPSQTKPLNRELSTLLVYLRSPTIVAKAVVLMQQPPEREAGNLGSVLERNKGYGGSIAAMLANYPDVTQMHYALVLRNVKEGWTMPQRKAYFGWFERARTWSGGASYQGFLRNIEREAFENASEGERLAIEAFGARKPYQPPELPKPAGPGREWKSADLIGLAEHGLKDRNFEQGQKMYAAARCIICHRFAGDGGATGPDLTQLAGRFTVKDLSEAMIEPSKVISDQYRATLIETKDGQIVSGRVVSESDGTLTVVTNPEDPTKTTELRRDNIDAMQPSPVSLMPDGLLKPLNQDEVLDLLAYLLSRGNKNDPMFKRSK